MKKNILPAIALIFLSVNVCTSQSLQEQAAAAKAAATKALGGSSTSSAPLSNDQVVSGLKNALTVGTNNSTALASKVDGYYKNPKITIPFPPQAKDVKTKADELGMKSQTDQFVMTLNRAAEEAAKNAAPVFIDAVKGMNVADGFTILKGANNAATEYLKSKTAAELTQKFTPIVKAALDKVQITKYWNPIITKYNKIPFVQKQNPDLTAYVTQKALDGLFLLIADEELKIRTNPAAQVTDILKQVFGSVMK